jgi:iron complex outermembrane receptor protein
MSVIRVACSVIALVLGLIASAAAQSASLVVRVADPDRAAVAGAPIVLMLPSGEQRTGITRSDGTFEFGGLVPGEYRLEIVAPGFSLYTETVTLGSGARTVDASLTIAGVREDITVLGEASVPSIGRINSPLRDQPLTVNTLTSEYLQQHAINDVVTALNHVSSVSAYSQYGVYQYFTFRGFADSVQMVDGIRNEGNRVNTQLSNVDRLEVLKGPASVLYGGDAVGATVNLVLKKPTAEPVYDLSAAAGRWETYRGAFGAGGRVGDSNVLFYRLDIGAESAENFRHDPSRRLNVTPTIMWRLTSSSQIEARHMYDRTRVSGDSGIPLVPLTSGFVPDPTRSAIGDPISRAVQGDGSDFIPKVPRDFRYNTPQDFGLGTDHNLRVSYSQMFGQNVALRNTLGYRHFDDEYWIAEFLDVTPPSRVNRGFLYFAHHRRPWINQAELTGRARLGIDHNFLLGWDYQDYDSVTDRKGPANFNTTPMDLYDPVETHINRDLDSIAITRLDYSTQRTNGVFFQDTLTVAPQVKVVVGGRYDRVRRSNHNNPVVNGLETEGPLTRGESEKFTYRAGLVYQPAGTVDIYVQNSTAFRPNFNIQADGTPLEPEEGELFEVGNRLRLLRDRVEISSAVFNVEKRNVARSIGGGNFDQIGKIRSRGFETELHGRVVSTLSLDLGYGFADAEFLDYFTNAGANLSGKTPRRAPEHTVSFTASYGWGPVAVSGGGRVVSAQFINDTNTVGFSGYEVLHAGISYTTGRMQYGLNLTNLTDREYFTSSLGNRQLYPGQPLNVMATVRMRTN